MDLDKSFKFVTYTQYDILSLLTYYIDFRLVVPVVSTSVGCTAYWVQIMACCRAGSKPLSDTMMIQFTDAYMCHHYNDVITGAMASQITSLTIVYAIVYSDGDQRKHQSSASLAFVRWIHRGPVNSPHKWRVTRKIFLFDDVIMIRPQWIWIWLTCV